MDDFTGETTELLQALIRNECVNDGALESGSEDRNVATLVDYFDGCHLDIEVFEPHQGRQSVLSEIPGTNPEAPSLCFMSHLDVVPAEVGAWTHDPFGGEIIDGEVWGRGAVDMLNLTASMAVAFKSLTVDRSRRYPGTISFLGLADEEAGGTLGAKYLCDHHPDKATYDMMVTEFGGVQYRNATETAVTVTTAEKGPDWRRITVKGVAGHGSIPYGGDNAVVTAAEVVRRIAQYRPHAQISDQWLEMVSAYGYPSDVEARLTDPAAIYDVFSELEPGDAAVAHGCTHTTFSPNVVSGGTKINTLAAEVVIDLDIRALPGETPNDVDEHIKGALGELYHSVKIESVFDYQPDELLGSHSVAQGLLWDGLSKAIQRGVPGARCTSSIITGATDARFFRKLGASVYGTGLLSPSVSASDFSARFHGADERIDLESLALTTNLWLDLVDVLWS